MNDEEDLDWTKLTGGQAAFAPQDAVVDRQTAEPKCAFCTPLAIVGTLVGFLVACFGFFVIALDGSWYIAATCGLAGFVTALVSLHHEIRLLLEWNKQRLSSIAEDEEFEASFARPTLAVSVTNVRKPKPQAPAALPWIVFSLFSVLSLLVIWLNAGNPWLWIVGIIVVVYTIYFYILRGYFGLMQMFEDSIAIFVVLLLIGGAVAMPSYLVMFLCNPSFGAALFSFIAHVIALGTSIKACVNGSSPSFCAVYYIVWEIAISIIAVMIAVLEGGWRVAQDVLSAG